MKTLLIACLMIVSFCSCQKNYMNWKMDGTDYAANKDLAANYRTIDMNTSSNVTPLIIRGATDALFANIYLLPENNYLGTFNFGDSDADQHVHYAIISYDTAHNDYKNKTWFANGDNDSRGTVTITLFDTLDSHRIEGTFEGRFYNSINNTYKEVTDGAFSLPLSVEH